MALTLIGVALLGAIAVYTFSSNQTTMGKKTIDQLKARSIAESGINIAYNQLRSDITLTNNPNPWPTTAFDGGSYRVIPSVVSSNRIVLVSIGSYRSAQAQVRVDLLYYPPRPIPIGAGAGSSGSIYGPYVFTNTLYIGGNCTWKGCGTFSGGSVYVNGLIDLGGNGTWTCGTGTLVVASSTGIETSGSGEITCTVAQAPSIVEKKSGGIVGTKIERTVPPPPLPTIELSPFFEVAKQNGQVKTGSVSVASGFTPAGGVLWCEGTLNFKGTATGCFIATAGVTMEAGADVWPINPGWPTVYNKAGDCTFTGQAETHGFVYSGGDVKFTGGGALQGGPVIIMGSLQKNGNSDMTDQIPGSGMSILPPVVNQQQYSNTLQRLVITGWQ
jgi:hypothetical protein